MLNKMKSSMDATRFGRPMLLVLLLLTAVAVASSDHVKKTLSLQDIHRLVRTEALSEFHNDETAWQAAVASEWQVIEQAHHRRLGQDADTAGATLSPFIVCDWNEGTGQHRKDLLVSALGGTQGLIVGSVPFVERRASDRKQPTCLSLTLTTSPPHSQSTTRKI